jgi:hypothetical protein
MTVSGIGCILILHPRQTELLFLPLRLLLSYRMQILLSVDQLHQAVDFLSAVMEARLLRQPASARVREMIV